MAELDPANKNSICTSHSTLYSLQPTTGAGSLPDCESDKLCARIAVFEESNLRTVELLRALSETCVVERAQAKTVEKERDGLLARVAALETSVAHERVNLKAERAGFQMERALLQSERAELDMNRESLRRERAAFEQGFGTVGRRLRFAVPGFVYLYKPTDWQVFLTITNNGSWARAIESNHALLLARGAALGASAANKGVTLDNGRERKALQVDSERINVDMMGESLRMQLAPSEKAMGAAPAPAPASTPSCTAANHLTARLRSRLRDYGGRAQAPEQREDLPVATLGSLATYAHRATDDDDREPTINLDMTHNPPLERALAALPNADLSSPSLAAAAALSVCPPATNHATAPPGFRRDFQEKEEEDRECDIGAPPRKRQKASSRNDLLPPPPETIPSPPALPDGYSLSDLSNVRAADPTKGMVLRCCKPRAPPPPPPPHDVPSARQPRNRAPPRSASVAPQRSSTTGSTNSRSPRWGSRSAVSSAAASRSTAAAPRVLQSGDHSTVSDGPRYRNRQRASSYPVRGYVRQPRNQIFDDTGNV
ncbi:hypothetical protein B0H17DRAFT_1236047 [Mycena rosella]|uniref:Uncharacterized protein n=1 Tax=Mycena rosella TaxID=1033263 RepID=A0AAD7GCI9_MYCRO|nr:hypothetical protein B0H17DRAFT_1236047 [Mycena rosella]